MRIDSLTSAIIKFVNYHKLESTVLHTNRTLGMSLATISNASWIYELFTT